VIVLVAGYFANGSVWLLSGGFSSPNPLHPPDHFVAVVEVLVSLSAVALVVLMAAVQATAPPDRKAFSLAALAFMTIFATLTSGVHFVWLTVLRQTPLDSIPPILRPDPWPSAVIALDMLAWGPVLGLSFLLAAPVFVGGKLQKAIRVTLTVGGTLSVAGVLGPATGDLRLWFFAMANYAVALPVICVLLALHFRAMGAGQPNDV
jgi:hypothetical protein